MIEEVSQPFAKYRPAHARWWRPRSARLAQEAEAIERIVQAIAVFDDFCHANDPHQEHDFGSFEVDGAIPNLHSAPRMFATRLSLGTRGSEVQILPLQPNT